MAKLKKGGVFFFQYSGYKEDPTPIALVLYVDKRKKLVHAININYLTPRLTDYLINMIALIALKQLNARDMFSFYHNYIKRKLPRVVRTSYRTYKSNKIKNVVLLSQGFDETKDYLNNLKKKQTKKKYEFVRKTIKKQIKKAINTQPIIFKGGKEIAQKKINKKVDEYMKVVQDIFAQREADMKKFTRRLK